MTSTFTAAPERRGSVFSWLPFLLLGVFFSTALKAVSDGFFLIDDVGMIHRGVEILQNPATLLTPDHAGRIHPVASLFWGVLHHFFKLRPFPYYAAWVFFHGLNVYLLFQLARRLELSPKAAWVSVLLFASASVHHQLVAWIGDGLRVMMVSFFLSAVLLHLQFLKTQRLRYEAAAYLTWLLALGCMEDAIVLPVILAVIDLLFEKREKSKTGNAVEQSGAGLGRWLRWSVWFGTALILAAALIIFLGEAVGRYTQHRLEVLPKSAGVVWTLMHLWIPRVEVLRLAGLTQEVWRWLLPVLLAGPALFFLGSRVGIVLKKTGALFFLASVWFLAAIGPFMLRELTEWKTFPAPRYFYLPLAGLALWAGAAARVYWQETLKIKNVRLKNFWMVSAVTAFVYYFALNTLTYSLMADKLDRAWRVEQPAVDFLTRNPQPEALRHYSFDLIES